MSFEKITKIPQFKDFYRTILSHAQYQGRDENDEAIYDESLKPTGTYTFHGTIKLHGTSSALIWDNETCELQFGSKERIIPIDEDNNGFAAWGRKHEGELANMLSELCEYHNLSHITLYGEWAGGSIQKGTGINKLDKAFYLFAMMGRDVYMCQDDVAHVAGNSDIGFFNVHHYPTYEITVDVAQPQVALDTMNEWVEAVDKVCPIALERGVEGHGEGIVFWSEDREFCFKVKGDSHKKGSGARKRASIDPIKAANIDEFVEKAMTLDRLSQGFDKAREEKGQPLSIKDTGTFVGWCVMDTLAEEGDALPANDLEPKDVKSALSKAASAWFRDKISQF